LWFQSFKVVFHSLDSRISLRYISENIEGGVMPDPVRDDDLSRTSEKQDQERMLQLAEGLFFFREIAMGLFHP
jgi:hypothetical protein